MGLDTAAELAAQLRVDSIRCSTSAGSGHPTSSMSAADLLAVLASRHLRYDWDEPRLPANDHLIFSKGHASPLLYSVFKAVGMVSEDELMTGYRRFDSGCKVTRRRCCRGSMSPPDRLDKACPMGSALRWRENIWIDCLTEYGHSAETASSPKAQFGRRSTKRHIMNCPT
jgi:hypothetical protein